MSELDFDSIIASGVLQLPLWDTWNQRIATTFDIKTNQSVKDFVDVELKQYILQVNSVDDFKSQVINKIPDFNIKDSEKFKQDINKAIETLIEYREKLVEYFIVEVKSYKKSDSSLVMVILSFIL